MDPCGTPNLINVRSDSFPLILVCKNQYANNVQTILRRPLSDVPVAFGGHLQICEFRQLTIQGKKIIASQNLHCHEKFTAFKINLALLHSKLDNKNFSPFPHLSAFLDENKLQVDDDVLEIMKHHVSILSKDIVGYFLDLLKFEK